MNYYLYLILTLFLSALSFGQTKKEVNKLLLQINEKTDIKALEKKYSSWHFFDLIVFDVDTSDYGIIVDADLGTIVQKEFNYSGNPFKALLKPIAYSEAEMCKVKYIFISGSEFSLTQIDSLQEVIIDKYNNGTPFSELVTQYNMDGNKTGDFPWFNKGMAVTEFDDAVRPMKKGEITSVDIPSKNWYYVVLKIEDNRVSQGTRIIRIIYED